MSTVRLPPLPPAPPTSRPSRPRRVRSASLFANGEPQTWLMGGALIFSIAMIIGLLTLVLWQGVATFWPHAVLRLERFDGTATMGPVVASERYVIDPLTLADLPPATRARAEQELAEGDGTVGRSLVRCANYDITNTHYEWVPDFTVEQRSRPEWALLLERLTWGHLYGTPAAFLVDGEVVADEPDAIWALFQQHHGPSVARRHEWVAIEDDEIGAVNATIRDAELDLKIARLQGGGVPPELSVATDAALAQASVEYERLGQRIAVLRQENARYRLRLDVASGDPPVEVEVGEVVRAVTPNRLGFVDKCGVYLSRWWEFLWDEPREGNTEGGVYPAIFGTVLMTLIMTLLVVPLGVLAALYLREYAKQGLLVSAVRVAVNNLAGVPSIVFGVFGLGFFCYFVGGLIDDNVLRYAANQPNPTFGKGGLMWAAFTLALLTLPVVIVATEEALSAVPSSMREGSYACGATKWQTIRRIVLPRAAPGIMTGMILAIARGAGEVAPLMLVGAVKLADKLPVDLSDMSGTLGVLPTGPLHLERSFMHLGYHIFDLGFHSPNSEAAKPMVYTTTLLLIVIIVSLNLLAIWVRARLRRRFEGTHI